MLFFRKSASRTGCTQSLKVWPLALCHYLNGIVPQRFLRAYRTIKAAAHHEGVQPLFVTLIPRVRFKSECGCRNIPRGTSRAPSAAASPDGKKPRRRFPHTLRIYRFFRRSRSDPPTYRRKASQCAEQFWWYGCTCPCGM